MQPASTARPEGRSRRLLLLLVVMAAALIALGVAGVTLASSSPEFHATTYEPPAPAADFTLSDHTGGTTALSDLRGTSVLLFFGYTHCPDVCPMTLSILREALEEADAGEEDVRVLLVSVDPERDTPEVLGRYVERFGPHVTGLTGSEETIRQILADYGVHSEPMHGDGSLLAHTSAVFGIDREGMIRVLLRPENPREELNQDIETLLEL